MASVDYWSASWYSASPADDLRPGHALNLIAFGGSFDEDGYALTITALTMGPGAESRERILGIENVRTQADPAGGRRIFFDVMNSGTDTIAVMNINFGFINS